MATVPVRTIFTDTIGLNKTDQGLSALTGVSELKGHAVRVTSTIFACISSAIFIKSGRCFEVQPTLIRESSRLISSSGFRVFTLMTGNHLVQLLFYLFHNVFIAVHYNRHAGDGRILGDADRQAVDVKSAAGKSGRIP